MEKRYFLSAKMILSTAMALTMLTTQKKTQANEEQQESTLQSFSLNDEEIDPLSNVLLILDEQGKPVEGASVLIGYNINDPFPDNRFITDESGRIKIPSSWKSPLPVTISAKGMIRTTFNIVSPTKGKFTLSRADGKEKLEIAGSTTNFGPLTQDGNVDFGLVIPAFKMQDLFHFDIASVISPESDQIKVVGKKIDIPSNLTLPKQTENYIFSIVLEKPKYRLYVREPGNYSFFALHGRFPLKQVVDEIRGGSSVFDVMNHFEFLEGGLTPLTIEKNKKENRDLSVNSFIFSQTIEASAPSFPNDKSLITLALANKGGLLVPTDLKRLLPNETLKLKTTSPSSSTRLLYVLTNSQNIDGESPEALSEETKITTQHPHNNDISIPPSLRIMPTAKLAPNSLFDQLTFVFDDGQQNDKPRFLDMIAPPQLETQSIRLRSPKIIKNVLPVATYLVLSEVEETTTGNITVEKKSRLWEIFVPNWVDSVKLPDFPLERLPNRRYRWEVMYFGRKDNGVKSSENNSYDLNTVTHITRNAITF